MRTFALFCVMFAVVYSGVRLTVSVSGVEAGVSCAVTLLLLRDLPMHEALKRKPRGAA